jgi:hypothetical protein
MKSMSWRRAMIASLGLCGALALVSPAVAQEEGAAQDAAQEEGLATVLRGLEWRAPKPKVLGHFKKLKEEEFQESSGKVRDPIVKERLRREMATAFEQIEKSDVSFTGQRSGYEVSIIAGEFRANNNESVIVVRDDNAQRYFLFADGNLWKLVIAYNPEYIQGIGFDAFVEQVSRKYGEPEATSFNDDEVLTSASWKDDATELRIEDKSDFFNTFTMVFADRKTAERMSKFQDAFGSGGGKKEGVVSQDILEIQKDSSFGNNEDVVDSILGSKVEVNLERGRPEDARARRVGDDPVASADADLPTEEAKKRKKGDKGKAGKGAKGKTDKGKGDSLIIY